MRKTQKQFTGLEVNLPASLDVGSSYSTSDTGKFFVYDKDRLPVNITENTGQGTQGYYGLLTDFYFGGVATDTTIPVTDINQWLDVEITVGANGLFDYRIDDMKVAQPLGHSGDGSTGDPIVFNLEGLDLSSFSNFRASMSFVPDEDEGQLETRLLFNRHSGATPSGDFSIEEVSLSMQGGADVPYTSEPMLSFFVGDTIDTNAVGDAGKCRFQVKSTVAGVLSMRALTWYLHKQ